MGFTTGIAWTDHTLNWWWGCEKITSACDYCYAEIVAKRFKGVEWGKNAKRLKIESAGRELKKFDRIARKSGEKRKLFFDSMSDIFEINQQVDHWREELFQAMNATTNLHFLVLTKRPANAKNYQHLYPASKIWLGTSIGEAKHISMAYQIIKADAIVHWISYEPAIGPIDVRLLPQKIDWLVIGGESGSPRPFHIEWAIDAIQKCRHQGIKVFMKQLGRNPFYKGKPYPISDTHGKIMDEWPDELKIQEFPL